MGQYVYISCTTDNKYILCGISGLPHWVRSVTLHWSGISLRLCFCPCTCGVLCSVVQFTCWLMSQKSHNTWNGCPLLSLFFDIPSVSERLQWYEMFFSGQHHWPSHQKTSAILYIYSVSFTCIEVYCREVTLCGWQDIKIQLLKKVYMLHVYRAVTVPASCTFGRMTWVFDVLLP